MNLYFFNPNNTKCNMKYTNLTDKDRDFVIRVIYYMFIFLISLFVMGASCEENKELSNQSEPLTPSVEEVEFVPPLAGQDELGRALPKIEDVGELKDNKQVGIFYFLWQGDEGSKTSEKYWDLSEIIPQHPEVLEDGKNKFWGSTSRGYYYFWGKPIYGYYSGDDYWVHLKNMKLLTDANVDFLVLDATNRLIYKRQSEALMKAITTLQEQGKNPPKLVYYTNSKSGETMQDIYNSFYKTGAPHYYPTTWYYLDDKPLIIGRTKETKDKDFESFFSYKESQWPNEPEQANGWPWIDFNRPQSVYSNNKGEREIINVSVCQHPNAYAGMGGSAFYGNKDNWGRSYRNGSHANSEKDILHGYNFQEQWDYALEQDVPYVFITSWNEWIAGRWETTDNNPEHSYFCDQASPEYSRDIEPTFTAGMKDNYYMQLVANIRRYKGMNSNPSVSAPKKIESFNDWDDVKPVYVDYINDTQDRNHEGAVKNPSITYTNTTGRNDFHILKVARDKENIYFFAQTANNISKEKSDNWMTLYINSDRKYNNDWYGYDYRITEGNKLQKYSNGKWVDYETISLALENNMLMYSLPIKYISENSQNLDFEFKWSDNMQDNDPMDWYINGDVAPEGRFNYIYKTSK